MAICESCGRDERETVTVQRIYLVPTEDAESVSGDVEASTSPSAGDIEQWCASCCATFPHAVIDPDSTDD